MGSWLISAGLALHRWSARRLECAPLQAVKTFAGPPSGAWRPFTHRKADVHRSGLQDCFQC